SSWEYNYDNVGQLTSAKRSWSDGNPVPGQQFEYAFDETGNRTTAAAGGDAAGASLRSFAYTANYLGQITNRTTPDSFDMIGTANAGASVSVNGTNVVYRHAD